MNEKPEIIFTFPNCMGGVASFNRNIINFSKLKKQCHTKVILLRCKEDERPVFYDEIYANEIIHFTYSNLENQYHVCRRLDNLLGKLPGAIITDNSLTLNTLTLFPTKKTVYSLVHDYYYVRLTLRHISIIDIAIAHSSFFKDILFSAYPSKFSKRALYVPYGVEQPRENQLNESENLKLVFLGRLTESKGVRLLFEIESELKRHKIKTEWIIIGSGPLEGEIKSQWIGKKNCQFYTPDTTQGVYDLLAEQDILVLPTFFEGTPVSILEAISHGVIPVVSNLPGGIRDIVTEKIGFRCQVGNPCSFANAIQQLDEQRDTVRILQANCKELGRKKYDINNSADHYFEKILKFNQFKSRNKKNTVSSSFSRLDSKYLPNRLVYLIRSIR